jgi:hypothetical protein
MYEMASSSNLCLAIAEYTTLFLVLITEGHCKQGRNNNIIIATAANPRQLNIIFFFLQSIIRYTHNIGAGELTISPQEDSFDYSILALLATL